MVKKIGKSSKTFLTNVPEEENAEDIRLKQILMDSEIHAAKSSLSNYQSNFDSLRTENNLLKQELRKRDEDHVQISGYLQQDVEQRTSTINKLQQDLFDQRQKYEEEIRDLQLKIQYMQKDYEQQLEEKDDLIADQEHTLSQFDKVKRERKILEDVLQDKEKHIMEIRTEYEQKIQFMQLQFVQEKVNLEKKEKKIREELEKDIQKRAMELLDAKSKEIHQENKKLHQLQREFQDNMNELAHDKDSLLETNKKLKLSSSMQNDSIKTYAKQGFKLSQEVRSLKEKVKTTQTTLNHVVKKHQEEKHKLKKAHELESENHSQEVEQLKNLLRVRTTELYNLRKLAKNVVKQRSELELFFMECLNDIKKAKLREMKKKRATMERKESTSTELPPIHEPSYSKDTAGSKAKRRSVPTAKEPSTLVIDQQTVFENLTWEDKETVIKLLFSKLNNYAPPMNQFASTNTKIVNHSKPFDRANLRLNTPTSRGSVNSTNDTFIYDASNVSSPQQFTKPLSDLSIS
mmetsp:Transcript_10540/g.15406  ORF Transcript_10540/g.15406 Transcript_10540/m.15406 type:complete len:517 (+) Transcript_10540:980-2530(+)|eukprot:CAMPEP_0117430880 /NCGR_PEP_ID=MMETSP0758-20121206/10434_1 /TAXON_ID=63605 /ORGANISM="Percolomonas cosmopolitus, Strain AE-1 (ATCC 50343)" /LENGTH=516 /DNA_ID=CAMNT_0005219371 /DNA_START=553 /DNA_END=2103 /DNA_ORIENTATION=-